MIVNLQITYDTNVDSCQVGGIPMATIEQTGEQIVFRGLCYAALEHAKKVVAEFDPNKKAEAPGILIAGAVPPNGNERR